MDPLAKTSVCGQSWRPDKSSVLGAFSVGNELDCEPVQELGVRARLRCDPIAGTKSSRATSKKFAEAAREKLRTDGSQLEAEIRLLQEKLDELNRDANEKQKQVDAESEAVAGLRKYIPPHIEPTINN